MRSKNVIGQSRVTEDKAQGLTKLLRQHMSVVKRVFSKYGDVPETYYYIDANAGSGYNTGVNCIGSPLIFLDAQRELDITAKAWFIDNNDSNILQLNDRLHEYENNESVTFTTCIYDNHVAVPMIARMLPAKSYGLIYFDPNGRPDWDIISQLSKITSLSKFDILIRYNTVADKRSHQFTGKLLLDYLADVNKRYWQVRDLKQGDRWQWTFLLGLNWRMTPWKSQRFHYMDSPEGRSIIDKIAYIGPNKPRHETPLSNFSTGLV